jgi:hypothetical protein
MRTRLKAGAIILVAGVVLLAIGAAGILGSIKLITTFNEPHTGEYVSAEILLNSTSGVAVQSPAAVGGIIPAEDLNSVNSNNVGSYAVPHNSTAAGTQVYRSLTGDYYYVAFSSAAPATHIVVTPLRSSTLGYGLLVIVSFVCIVAGVILVIMGVRKTNRQDQVTDVYSQNPASPVRSVTSPI